jgi:hypothetical protein
MCSQQTHTAFCVVFDFCLVLVVFAFCPVFCPQLDQLKAEKHKLHKEKVDLENQLEAEQV